MAGVADKIRDALPRALMHQALHAEGWEKHWDDKSGSDWVHPRYPDHAIEVHPFLLSQGRSTPDWRHFVRGRRQTSGAGHESLKAHLKTLGPKESPYEGRPITTEDKTHLAAKIRKALPTALIHHTLHAAGWEKTWDGSDGSEWSHPEHRGSISLRKYPSADADNDWEHWSNGEITKGRGHESLRAHLKSTGPKTEDAEKIRAAIPQALAHRHLADYGWNHEFTDGEGTHVYYHNPGGNGWDRQAEPGQVDVGKNGQWIHGEFVSAPGHLAHKVSHVTHGQGQGAHALLQHLKKYHAGKERPITTDATEAILDGVGVEDVIEATFRAGTQGFVGGTLRRSSHTSGALPGLAMYGRQPSSYKIGHAKVHLQRVKARMSRRIRPKAGRKPQARLFTSGGSWGFGGSIQ